MKTVKKLLSLMLVAMLLVTAIPFQASAEAGTCTIVVGGTTYTVENEDDKEILTADDLWMAIPDEADVADFDALDEYINSKAPVDLSNGNVKLDFDGYYANLSKVEPVETPAETPVQTPDVTPLADTQTYPVRLFENGEEGAQVGTVECDPTESSAAIFNKANFTTGTAADYELHGFAYGTLWVKRVKGSTVVVPSGSGTEAAKYTVNIETNGGTVTKKVPEGTKYFDALAGIGDAVGKKITGYRSAEKGILKSTDVVEGNDTVTILYETTAYSLTLDVNRKGVENATRIKRVYVGQPIGELPTPVASDGYVFVGWKLFGKYINADTIWQWDGDATAYAEYKLANDKDQPMGGTGTVQDGKVYLEIYTNNNTKTVAKRINITSYADDNKITQAEAEKVIRSYFTAKSGYSLKMIGLFNEEGWWNYTHDPETNGKKEIVVNRDGDDYVYVMVNNVKTSVADTSNPKTGDSIATTLAALGLSVSALAALCYIAGKKRLF